MHWLQETIPDALGAAWWVSGDGGWRLVEQQGEVDSDAALALLRAGEPRLFDDQVSADLDEVEVVFTKVDRFVVVANSRSAIVLRLSRSSNIGLALGYAHGLVRGVA